MRSTPLASDRWPALLRRLTRQAYPQDTDMSRNTAIEYPPQLTGCFCSFSRGSNPRSAGFSGRRI
jgi:hypothetical protein